MAADRLGKLAIQVGLDSKRMAADAKKVRGNLKSINAGVNVLKSSVQALGVTFGAAFAVSSIKRWVSEAAEIGNVADRVNASTDAIQIFELAVRKAGGTLATAGTIAGR